MWVISHVFAHTSELWLKKKTNKNKVLPHLEICWPRPDDWKTGQSASVKKWVRDSGVVLERWPRQNVDPRLSRGLRKKKKIGNRFSKPDTFLEKVVRDVISPFRQWKNQSDCSTINNRLGYKRLALPRPAHRRKERSCVQWLYKQRKVRHTQACLVGKRKHQTCQRAQNFRNKTT